MDSFTSAQPSKAEKITNNKRKASPKSTVAEGRPTKVAKLDELSNDSTIKPAPATKRPTKNVGRRTHKIATSSVSQSAGKEPKVITTTKKVMHPVPIKDLKRKRVVDTKKDNEALASATKKLKQSSAADQSDRKHSNQENVNPRTGSVRGRQAPKPTLPQPSKPLASSTRRAGNNKASSMSDVDKAIKEQEARREREDQSHENRARLFATIDRARQKVQVENEQREADDKARKERERRDRADKLAKDEAERKAQDDAVAKMFADQKAKAAELAKTKIRKVPRANEQRLHREKMEKEQRLRREKTEKEQRLRRENMEKVLKACGVTREIGELIDTIEAMCSTWHFGEFLQFQVRQQQQFVERMLLRQKYKDLFDGYGKRGEFERFHAEHGNIAIEIERGLNQWRVSLDTVDAWKKSGKYDAKCRARLVRYLSPTDGSGIAKPVKVLGTSNSVNLAESTEPARKRKRDSDDERVTTSQPRSKKCKADAAREPESESIGAESGPSSKNRTVVNLQRFSKYRKDYMVSHLFPFHKHPTLDHVNNEKTVKGMILVAYDKNNVFHPDTGIEEAMKAFVWRKLEMALDFEIGELEGLENILPDINADPDKIVDTAKAKRNVRYFKREISRRYRWSDLKGRPEEYFWDRFNDLKYEIPGEIVKLIEKS
jgi:hypothetical protein